jgi:two-component system, OmpR family, aerobic respiration control sensor histidine kinase ArcB
MNSKEEKIEQLEKIIATMPGYVYWKNSAGLYQGCNENFVKLFKLNSCNEVIGKNDIDLSGQSSGTQIMRNDAQIIRNKTEMTLEEKSVNILGEPAVYLSKKKPLLDEHNNVVGILGISIDITEQKQAAEKAKAKNHSKSQFLSIVNHELRTPLTGILGMARLLSLESLLPALQRQVQDIIYSSEHMLSLLNELLDLTKLESGAMELNNAPFSLRKTLEETIAILHFQAEEKKLGLLIEYDKNTPEMVIGDERALKLIVINLVENAIQFTENGYVLISVKRLKQKKNKTEFLLTVQDTGTGFSEQQLLKLFSVEQIGAEQSYQRNYNDVALGLTICKTYLELMQGTIQVESKKGKGTLISCVIPLQLREIKKSLEDKKLSALQKKASPVLSEKNHKKILLVEDDDVVQKVHRTMLERLGYYVDIAETGGKALAMLPEKYHIIFMDIGLPDITGLEVTHAIRKKEQEKNLNRIPVIAITAHGSKEDKENCLKAGIDEMAVKPITLPEFEEILGRWFGNK